MESKTHTTATIDVLLVEDNESHVRLMQRVFESSGVSVELRHARDLKSMRTELDRRRPHFLILDYLLPDGRSLDAVSGETRLDDIPTVVITGFMDDQVVFEARNVGVRGLVPKSQSGFMALPQIVRSEFSNLAL